MARTVSLPTDLDSFLSPRQVVALTSLSGSTLRRYVLLGAFPAPRWLGPRRRAWLRSEIVAWLTARTAGLPLDRNEAA